MNVYSNLQMEIYFENLGPLIFSTILKSCDFIIIAPNGKAKLGIDPFSLQKTVGKSVTDSGYTYVSHTVILILNDRTSASKK